MKKYTYLDVVTNRKVHSDVPINDPALKLLVERKDMQMKKGNIRTT